MNIHPLFNAGVEAGHKACADQIEALQKALRLAVNMLSIYEPPDSRAVSDEFVALAAIDAGDRDDSVVAVIDAALARQAECSAETR